MWSAMGASVRGPEHRRDGRPNQDAWLGRITREAALAVVCDGLGSRPHSAVGSRAACRAVATATRQWVAGPDSPPELLLRLVHALWNLRVRREAHRRDTRRPNHPRSSLGTKAVEPTFKGTRHRSLARRTEARGTSEAAGGRPSAAAPSTSSRAAPVHAPRPRRLHDATAHRYGADAQPDR